MDYLITAIVLAIWSFLWYELGFLQAQLKELDRDIRKIEKQIKEDRKNNLAELTKLSDSYEEIVHRS
ncbi:hypothetical protein [Peptoniphilus hominis (ex Hitch et al. 2025)]|uniref:Uncharacterized protein n=1 Tax=Peptoniphilus hominis (ex Hitch et al. 2025) TaxID=3133174 RepID=A0ABV1CBY1_9FIRM